MELTANLTNFARDVEKGLSAPQKYLSSSFFYDEVGSIIFQQIMDLPEYYLTRCEAEILNTHRQSLLEMFNTETGFDLLELGAGDGAKTTILLEHFLKQGADFSYGAIDISPSAVAGLEAQLKAQFPTLGLQMVAEDYFSGLKQLQLTAKRRKIVLFMGSTVGNFNPKAAIAFLKQLRPYMNETDLFCIGFDLKKQPQMILDAYNDAQGVTAEFNYNLLRRMNEELKADFNVEQFEHAPIYHPQNGCAESYLVSKVNQNVYIEALDKTFSFKAWEAIHTEVSYKYSLQDMEDMAKMAGFVVKKCFFDRKQYFCNAIWTISNAK
jgi:L-histidine Nalpha-methyltransferase